MYSLPSLPSLPRQPPTHLGVPQQLQGQAGQDLTPLGSNSLQLPQQLAARRQPSGLLLPAELQRGQQLAPQP